MHELGAFADWDSHIKFLIPVYVYQLKCTSRTNTSTTFSSPVLGTRPLLCWESTFWVIISVYMSILSVILKILLNTLSLCHSLSLWKNIPQASRCPPRSDISCVRKKTSCFLKKYKKYSKTMKNLGSDLSRWFNLLLVKGLMLDTASITFPWIQSLWLWIIGMDSFT